MVGFAAHESVDSSNPDRFGHGWSGRRADLPGRRLVVLAEEARAVAVQAKHLGQRRYAVRAMLYLNGYLRLPPRRSSSRRLRDSCWRWTCRAGIRCTRRSAPRFGPRGPIAVQLAHGGVDPAA